MANIERRIAVLEGKVDSGDQRWLNSLASIGRVYGLCDESRLAEFLDEQGDGPCPQPVSDMYLNDPREKWWVFFFSDLVDSRWIGDSRKPFALEALRGCWPDRLIMAAYLNCRMIGQTAAETLRGRQLSGQVDENDEPLEGFVRLESGRILESYKVERERELKAKYPSSYPGDYLDLERCEDTVSDS